MQKELSLRLFFILNAVMNTSLINCFDNPNVTIPTDLLIKLLSDENHFLFVKNDLSVIKYANERYVKLLGYKQKKEVYEHDTLELSRDKKQGKIYLQHDEEVLDTGKPLNVSSDVCSFHPKPLIITMQGTIYPVFDDSARPLGIIGLVQPILKTQYLSLEDLVCLNEEQLHSILHKRSWSVRVFNYEVSLSKREIQCLAGLVKGRHAGEISESLQLKQSTVESYIDNLKNKLGAYSKSNLLDIVFSQKIIQQITF